MESLQHIIRRQYLDVEVNGSESEALLLTHRLSDLCQHSLTPALDKSLEKCAPKNWHLYIERLVIDAGALTLDTLERDLVESVTRAVEKAIRERIPPEINTLMTSESATVRLKTIQRNVDEAFLFFLKTGSLPWSFRLPENRNLEQVVLESWLEAEESGAQQNVFIDTVFHLLASTTVRERLIRQFSRVFLEKLFSMLSPEANKALDEVFQVLRRSDSPPADLNDFERSLWELAFASLATGEFITARRLVSQTYRVSPIRPPRHAALINLLETYWPGATKKEDERINNTELINRTELITPTAPKTETTPPRIDEQLEVREGIYVDNAGLVLLHPFLPRFFEAIGVASEYKLLKPDRALCLLHFLATGQPVSPEYELILPKILCNIPLETSVESNVELTTAELEESAALLEAVIRHWEALRNTSPDGLRGAFLLRPGKVILRDDGDWLLHVESKTLDILLEQLLWGISIIKLPWMESRLWVEWK